MNIITTKVNCRGCQTGATLKFKSPSVFSKAEVPFTCKKCGSELMATVKRDFLRRKIMIKVNMINHTQTLLNILKRRQASA